MRAAEVAILIVAVGGAWLGCTGDERKGKEPASAASATTAALPDHQRVAGVVIETMTSGGYTYIQLERATGRLWCVAPETKVAIGDKVEFGAAEAVTNFYSNSLERTFEAIYVVPGVVVNGVAPVPSSPGFAVAPKVDPSSLRFDELTRPTGGKTVAEILAERETLAGQEVFLKAKVVKYNARIMNRNWLHLQDGTDGPAGNDLMATTKAEVAVGDTVMVRGKVTIDRDFGGGYLFATILEDAAVTRE